MRKQPEARLFLEFMTENIVTLPLGYISRTFAILTILAFPAPKVFADGLLEGMADGINEIADDALRAADAAGKKIKSDTAPAVKSFSENVNKIAFNVADFLSDAANRIRENAGSSQRE